MFENFNFSIAVIVFFARVCDVGLGTLRHTLIIRGRRSYAFIIAFFESLIWIYAVSRVMTNVQDPLTSLAFALGFATGTYVGMSIEGFLKIGEQVIRIFSRSGEFVAEKLRENGYRVTTFDGNGRDGVVKMLLVQVKRKNVMKVTAMARKIDPNCFIIIDDIRSVSIGDSAASPGGELTPAPAAVTAESK
ncbi:MAG TPA: DUF2179 domain-containing protein [Chitinispirillaceae bacterium]|nr:DUF2179 domain-containing protein [Chitinispirillaceae bacterium]